MESAANDARFLRRALTLAKRGKFTHPNPKVGAVIVRDGVIVSEGWHLGPGTPHAEAMAFSSAGDAARGATIYVTLEPCAHTHNADGSPRVPCAARCIGAGVSRVVCAMQDPDPRTAGRGIESLQVAGVAVTVGVREAEARALNRPFIKHRETGLPYILHKAAMTLDGKIATVTGSSRWVTGGESRAFVHRALRNTVDAVIVGIGTVLTDDPSLTTRLAGGNAHAPLRVIIDSALRTPTAAKAVGPGTIVYANDDADTRARIAGLTDRGANVVLLPPGTDGRVDLTSAMRHLCDMRGALSLLLEAGAELAAGFYGARLVDAALVFVAPKLVGGRGAPTPIGGDGLTKDMNRALRAGTITVRRFGADIALHADVLYDVEGAE